MDSIDVAPYSTWENNKPKLEYHIYLYHGKYKCGQIEISKKQLIKLKKQTETAIKYKWNRKDTPNG